MDLNSNLINVDSIIKSVLALSGEYTVLVFDQSGYNSNLSNLEYLPTNMDLVTKNWKLIFGSDSDLLNQNLVSIPSKFSKVLIINTGLDLQLDIILSQSSQAKIVYLQIGSLNNILDFHLHSFTKLQFFGLNIISKDQQLSTTVKINHLSSDSSSKCVFKNLICNEDSKISLDAEIFIPTNLLGIVSDLQLKTLKINPKSRVKVQPKLKIFSKDVFCSHSNTISNIASEEINYLLSRGLDLEAATKILLQAFYGQIYTELQN